MANTTNQKVLIWARGKKGQQVGRGECWDLADRALRHAGANSSPTTGLDDDYTWGDPVAPKDVKPGDVLQFRDYIVTTTIKTDMMFDDGSGSIRTAEKTARRGHHTAIVDSVLSSGAVVVLEQHVKPLGKKVQRHVIPTHNSSLPPTTSYKLVKNASGKSKLAKVIETVTIVISGKMWAYRPKIK